MIEVPTEASRTDVVMGTVSSTLAHTHRKSVEVFVIAVLEQILLDGRGG